MFSLKPEAMISFGGGTLDVTVVTTLEDGSTSESPMGISLSQLMDAYTANPSTGNFPDIVTSVVRAIKGE